MGSLGSNSKQSSPQIVYMPAPAPYVPSTPTTPPVSFWPLWRRSPTASKECTATKKQNPPNFGGFF